jgi:phosphate-selective porin OprO and OprP
VTSLIRISALALVVSAGWVLPAHASAASDAAIQQELAAMRAQMAQMASRIDSLEGELGDARAKAAAAEAKASAASAAVAAIPAQVATATAKPATEVTWDGAPRLATKDGWSFKPRGRLQVDMAGVNAPAGLAGGANKSLGIATEFRRAYIGFDGTMPGGFGYRIEADFANSSVDLTDLYLTYKASPKHGGHDLRPVHQLHGTRRFQQRFRLRAAGGCERDLYRQAGAGAGRRVH